MQKLKVKMFQVIRDILDSENKKKTSLLSEKEISDLFQIMNSFDLAPFLSLYVEKHHIQIENLDLGAALNKKKMEAIYRYQRFEFEREDLRAFFLNAKMKSIYLKGTVLRDLYPQGYLRTSADIDVLVEESDYLNALELFSKDEHYEVGSTCEHHTEMQSSRGVNIELHRALITHDKTIAKPLENIWDLALTNPYSYESAMPQEYFLYYLLAHMEKHFVHGGCGIRPFLDIYLFEKKRQIDRELFQRLLQTGHLESFYFGIQQLISLWLEDGPESELTSQMEAYLFDGGIYGSVSNQVKVGRTGKGKLSYLFSRIFLPYSKLIYIYPKLKGKKILTPLYEIKRWFRLLFQRNRNRAKTELSKVSTTTQNEIDQTKVLLESLGIGESGLV